MLNKLCFSGKCTVAVFCCLLILFPGCASYNKEPLLEPTVQVRDFEITNVHLTGFEGLMILNVKNPNNVKLKASELSYALTVANNELVRGQNREHFSIPAHGEDEIELPVEMSFASLFETLPKIAKTGIASYSITGHVKTGIATVPFTKQGEFRLPLIPAQLKE